MDEYTLAKDEDTSRIWLEVRTRLWRQFKEKARQAGREPRHHAAILIEREAERQPRKARAAVA
jgi:hypothetical protein